MTANGSSNRPSLAVVLPALNEANSLATTLQSLQSQTEPAERVLVVDGGSSDGTENVPIAFGSQLLSAPRRGRGGQIAAGVAQIAEDVVLVAHADMVFPPRALESIRNHLVQFPACPGGCLGHRFDSPRRVFRVIEWFDRRRAVRGVSYGDQGQFFRRETLAQAGSFPDQPIMEDVELSRRLQRAGRPAYLDLPVKVSPRRFERIGVFRALLTNWTFRLAYRWRGPAACLAIHRRYYAGQGQGTKSPRNGDTNRTATENLPR